MYFYLDDTKLKAQVEVINKQIDELTDNLKDKGTEAVKTIAETPIIDDKIHVEVIDGIVTIWNDRAKEARADPWMDGDIYEGVIDGVRSFWDQAAHDAKTTEPWIDDEIFKKEIDGVMHYWNKAVADIEGNPAELKADTSDVEKAFDGLDKEQQKLFQLYKGSPYNDVQTFEDFLDSLKGLTLESSPQSITEPKLVQQEEDEGLNVIERWHSTLEKYSKEYSKEYSKGDLGVTHAKEHAVDREVYDLERWSGVLKSNLEKYCKNDTPKLCDFDCL